jgi:Transposase IS116/IS110/IS902 family
MLDALVHGTTDPEVLAELAKGRLRAKLPALKEALEGRFDHLHALWIGAILAHIDFLDEQIDRLSDAIEEQIAPFEKAVELLGTIPGVQRRAAEVIISEIGVDMTVFPTEKHLASWAGQCPGNDQSAGKRRSGKSRKGSKWLDWSLEESALAAVRTKDVYLAAQYARLSPAAVTRKHSAPSNSRSSAPAGTCSKPASCTTTSAATTSNAATPNAKPNGSSANSKRSDTPSRSNQHQRQRQRRWSQPERYFPVRAVGSRRAGWGGITALG